MQATETIRLLVEEIRQLAFDAQVANKLVEERKNRLKDLMGDHEVCEYYGVPLATYKHLTRSGIDSKRLQAEMPDIYERYQTQSAYRQLVIK